MTRYIEERRYRAPRGGALLERRHGRYRAPRGGALLERRFGGPGLTP